MKNKYVLSLALVALTAMSSPNAFAQSKSKPQPKIDPKAEEVLRDMSQYLAGLKTFRYSAEHNVEAVLKSGQKLDFIGESDVAVQRPNKFRSDRKGEIVDMSFFYDGKMFSLLGRNTGMYATTEAPNTIDKALEDASDRLNLDAPGADLLHSNPYSAMMDGVQEAMYVGEAEIGGQKCHHLAFRNADVDWQLWVTQGPKPLPKRYVIVSKKEKGQPEYVVQFEKWDPGAKIAADEFRFVPPKDATRIAFASDIKESKSSGKVKQR
ncbi:MAG TPA: DUF2092 domain-containing protein [Bdellovibrionales bacterium]|jgi:hypothetical protein|nr:DUF2092 domain-containing protein [Bdellovibrionales bacterium]